MAPSPRLPRSVCAPFLAVLFAAVTPAQATRWIGPASSDGVVERPELYLAEVAPLVLAQFDWDDLETGQRVSRFALDDFALIAHGAPDADAVVGEGTVAGAMPATAPRAVLITASAASPARLDIVLFEPVISVAFVLMGFESSGRLKVIGADEAVLGDYYLGGAPTAQRRWVAVSEDDRNIHRVEIIPDAPGDYALDDIEIGVHAPEPSALATLALGAMLAACRTRRRTTT